MRATADKTRRYKERASRGWSLGARILLLFTGVLLAIMPLTEHFWTFDGSLPGGQDFELTLLAVLAMFCMVLLLAQYCTEKIAGFIELREWVSPFCLHDCRHALRRISSAMMALRESCLAIPAADSLRFPLLI